MNPPINIGFQLVEFRAASTPDLGSLRLRKLLSNVQPILPTRALPALQCLLSAEPPVPGRAVDTSDPESRLSL